MNEYNDDSEGVKRIQLGRFSVVLVPERLVDGYCSAAIQMHDVIVIPEGMDIDAAKRLVGDAVMMFRKMQELEASQNAPTKRFAESHGRLNPAVPGQGKW